MENRQLLYETGLQPPRTPMEAFQSLPEGTRMQLIENVLIMEPAPTYLHQDILGELYFKMVTHVKDRRLGKVLVAPLDVYLDAENVFQPDIFFVSGERMHLMRENGFHGAPDLVVEMLSPSTAKYDRKDKMRVYSRTGVKEYWLVNPKTRLVQGYRLVKGGFNPFPPAEGVLSSALLGEAFNF